MACPDRSRCVFKCFQYVALDLIRKCTELSKSVESWKKALYHLAERPHAFQSGNHLGFWDRQIYQWIQIEQECNGFTQLNCFFWKSLAQIEPSLKKVWEKKLMHIQAHTLLEHLVHKVIKLDNQLEVAKLLASSLSVAAKFGVVEFFNVVFQSYPPMLGYFGYTMLSILQNAIVNRQAKIFQFLKKTFGSAIAIGNYRDTSKDTILHSAAKLSTSPQLNSIPGAALRMQSELQWFKEVEKIVPPHFGNLKNSEDMTAQAVFTKEHKHLVVEGEKWMKETATSCSLIAVLIVTVAFAAGFTVPGGYKDNQGIPVFLGSNSFKVFAISDALAFFSSTASLLMFLSIFTTRYTEETFLNALPRKLIFGIMMLFLSVAATMVAFSGGYIIMLDNQFPLVVVLLALLAFAPVTVLALLHIPLFVEVVLSTYRHPFY
ncbi:PREDICTED: uncharacterized protein LOC104596682 [Nelumbo nucifera]|uniref:Uncharacterized protein LOC104596682 n=2 Tax=Nelumbo nucifera TaxID=4432 RepID=A0A1U7ZRX3_NELNU|nr:PREDICTED: uncharacterized protein LOC104596682 [Nelumbo nucifera]DAD39380.1 TPA_asm: hypothetical protein HUJ06_013703 [Nelumbo nucifera]